MKKIILALIITLLSINVNARGGGGGGHGGGHAAGHGGGHAASHSMLSSAAVSHPVIFPHGSSDQSNQTTGGELTKNEKIGVCITFFTFLFITVFALIWSEE